MFFKNKCRTVAGNQADLDRGCRSKDQRAKYRTTSVHKELPKGCTIFATRQIDESARIAFDHSILFDCFAHVVHDALSSFF